MAQAANQSGIQLIEARVRNFRSLRRVDIALDDLTVFIGENNSGKTSLLEALYAAIGSGRSVLSADDIFLAKGEAKPPKERTVIIDLLFRPVDEQGAILEDFPLGSYWTQLWGNGRGLDDDDNIIVALRTQLRWDSGKGEYKTERRLLTRWPQADALDDALINETYGSVSGANLEPIALYFMDAKRDMHDELQNRSSFWHKLIKDTGLSERQVKRLERILSRLNQYITAGSAALSHVQTHLNDLYQTVSAEKGKVTILPLARHLRDLNRGMDISFSTRDAEAFPLTRHGMGTRSLAAVLTFRAYSEWRQQNAKGDAVHPMLALEEPEAHLHPQAQRALFNQIEAIPGQRIISTHSPYIASQADISSFRHFRKVGAETLVSRIDTQGLDEEDIRKINRMVLNTRGELLFARALVFFEGETEEQALPVFAKAYWGEHINTLGISMIGVDGSGNYFPFARLAESFAIPWFIFSDGEADTIRRLSHVLKKLDKPEQVEANDNIFVIPNGKDFEAYLIDEGYQDALIDAIIQKQARTEQHREALQRRWQAETDKDRTIEEELSAGKTLYARPIAEAITILEDNKETFSTADTRSVRAHGAGTRLEYIGRQSAMNLSPTQQKIVRHGDGALLVVAGPGSGKTRVLTERIRRLLAEVEGHFHVLALTFTNKAANKMRERLEEIPEIHQRAFIGTLHSFCSEVLSNRGKPVGIEGLPHIFENFQDRKQVLREAALADPELAYELSNRGDARAQDKTLWQWLNAISEAKRQLLPAEAVSDALLAKVYAAYDEGLRHSNAVDYDDLLLLTYRLFVERPKIAGFYRRLYRYICVDEAQDLNEAQYRVLQALCGEEYRNVMLVGDPKQAIFQWNGAHPKYLDLFERDFSAVKISMHENYRSAAAIIHLACKLNPAYQPEGDYPISGAVEVFKGRDEKQEAEQVLAYLEKLLETGHPDIEGSITPERCAVLARNRYVFSQLENLLQQKGRAYYKQLSTQHESESTLLQDFELCLRLLSNPQDRLHLNALLQRWQLEVSILDDAPSTDCATLIRLIESRISSPAHRAVLEAIRAVGLESDSFRFLKGIAVLEQHIESNEEKELCLRDLQQWRTHWDVFLRGQSGQPTLRAFLAKIALGGTQKTKQDGLGLLTVHSAKGLEFDVVVVMGMMEGIFPDYRAVGQALEEEKRNFFVAVTRSKRLLCLSYAENRMTAQGYSKRQTPSRFLRETGLVD